MLSLCLALTHMITLCGVGSLHCRAPQRRGSCHPVWMQCDRHHLFPARSPRDTTFVQCKQTENKKTGCSLTWLAGRGPCCVADTLLSNLGALPAEARKIKHLAWVNIMLQADPSIGTLDATFTDHQSPQERLNHMFRLMRSASFRFVSMRGAQALSLCSVA